MSTHLKQLWRSLTMLVVTIAAVPAVSAECTPIDTAPTVISASGHYCLVTDVSLSDARGTAITIDSPDVVVDLQGFEMRGPHYGGLTTIPSSVAIRANNVGNITIRNGRISGFGTGVRLESSLPLQTGNLVENLHIDGNSILGIEVRTGETIVRDNRITGLDARLQSGTTAGLVWGIYSENIWGLGFGNQILRNSITGFRGQNGTTGSAGMRLQRASDTLIEGNYIQSTSPSAAYWGISITHSHNVTVLANRLHRLAYGIDYQNIAANTSGKYGNNVTERVSFPYRGVGTDIGNNF